MTKTHPVRPAAIALGATFAVTLAAAPLAGAAENPFAIEALPQGYLADKHAEGACGEGKCGAGMSKGEEKSEEASETKAESSEGKCGAGH